MPFLQNVPNVEAQRHATMKVGFSLRVVCAWFLVWWERTKEETKEEAEEEAKEEFQQEPRETEEEKAAKEEMAKLKAEAKKVP